MPTPTLAQQINQFLRARHSPLAGLGNQIVTSAQRAGRQYHVDPGKLARLVVGIAGGEQTYGTSGAPDVRVNNLWGWGHPPDAAGGMPFPTLAAGVDTVTRGLAKGYLSQGLTTPEQIAPKYVGPGAHTDWIKTVRYTLGQLGAPVGPPGIAPPAVAPPVTAPAVAPMQGPRVGDADVLALINSNNRIIGVPQLPPSLTFSPRKQPVLAKPVTTLQTPEGKTFPVVSDVKGPLARKASAAIKLAEEYLGTPYSWGGGGTQGPSYGTAQGANIKGFDCSSLLQYVWAKQGVNIPRVTYTQWTTGRAVSQAKLQPGDAVFFHMGSQGPEHVGMYIGGGQFIHAPHTGDVVKISKLAGYGGYVGARRFA